MAKDKKQKTTAAAKDAKPKKDVRMINMIDGVPEGTPAGWKEGVLRRLKTEGKFGTWVDTPSDGIAFVYITLANDELSFEMCPDPLDKAGPAVALIEYDEDGAPKNVDSDGVKVVARAISLILERPIPPMPQYVIDKIKETNPVVTAGMLAAELDQK